MEAFFRRVLPATGDYTLFTIDPRVTDRVKAVRHINGIKTIEALAKIVQRLSLEPLNIYFAVGSYAGKNRKDPIAKRCLYLDLDPKEFESKANAILELQKFVRATGFVAPSILVDSGHGVHAYWITEDMPVSNEKAAGLAWASLALALKRRCDDAGFPADPAVTADAMRILRAPGTVNHKEKVPMPCTVLKDWGTTYSSADLFARLSDKPTTGAASILAGTAGTELDNSNQSYPQVPYFGAEIANKCGVIGDALDTGGASHTEPLWSNVLSLLAFTEDSEQLIHLVSNKHPTYDQAKTIEKFAYKLDRKQAGVLKPVLCKTFASYKGSICNECPYNGRINTPLVLGKREDIAGLPPYYRMEQTGVFRLAKKGDAETPDEWKLVFPYHLSNVDLIDSGIGEERLKVTFTSKHNVIRMEIPTTLLSKDGSTLCETLVASRVYVGTNHANEFKGFMMSWIKKMSDIKLSTQSKITGMGWGSRGDTPVFVAGKKMFSPANGEEHFSHPEVSLVNDYTARGKPEYWTHAAKDLVSDGRYTAIATVTTAFAAPIIRFTGAAGVTFSIYSAASGTGKSSALKIAQAVWGHPIRGINALDDTVLSITKKIGFLNSLPAYWDEMRGDRHTIHGFIRMIFQLGQGKEKSRLTSSIKMQEMGTWETIVTLASNERVVDHVDQIVKSTNAGRMRVFEVTMPNLVTTGNTNIMRDISKLTDNYGHAGQVYAKYLANNSKNVEKLVQAMQDKLARELGTAADERFWLGFVTAQLAAVLLVNQLGILTIDFDAFKKWIVAEFHNQRSGVARSYMPLDQASSSSIMQFLEIHRDQILVSEFIGTMGVANSHGSILIQPINKEIIALKAFKDKVIRLKEAPFRTWVYATYGYSPTAIMNELMKTGAVSIKRASVTAGLANSTGARFNCIEIDLKHPAFSMLLDTN